MVGLSKLTREKQSRFAPSPFESLFYERSRSTKTNYFLDLACLRVSGCFHTM